MSIGEQIGIMRVTEGERRSAAPEAPGFVWRLEYTLMIGVMFLLAGFAIAFFYFSANVESLKSYGYAGLFLINVIGAASILLPSPAAASVFGGGALLQDFLGVPAFIWVGLVAGMGEAVGEFSGYAAGYGGRLIIQERPAYARIHAWMQKRGFITMFLMSTIPNPVFDIAGLAAGAVQMPLRSFFIAVLSGKIIKNTWIAAAGFYGVGVITQLI
jgi:membrane protein YqaA with SNARE-associated domain